MSRKIYNKKTKQQFSTDGGLFISQTFSEGTGARPVWKRRVHTATWGETTFFDIAITTEIKLESGGYHIYNIEDVSENDYIEFSIIDKNDVLGLFSLYGLTVGEDVLEIHKFIRTMYIDMISGEEVFKTEGLRVFSVLSGLFLRVAFNSSGETGSHDVKFSTTFLFDE